MKVIQKIRELYDGFDDHTSEVIRKSAASTIVKVAGMLIGLGVSVFLGRTLGADGLGIINLSTRVVQLLLIIGLLGMRQVIVKEVAIANSKNDLQRIGNVMYTAYILNGGISLFITFFMIMTAPWLVEHFFHEPRLKWPLVIAILVMVPQVLSRIFSSGLIGYKKIWQSNLVDQTLSMGITGTVLLAMWLLSYSLTINVVAVVYAFGRIVVTLSIGIYWHLLFLSNFKKKFIGKNLLKTALPLFLVTLTFVISANASTIMIGWLGDATMVGLFTVAVRISLLSSFFLQIVKASVSPKLASLFAEGKISEMEKMVQIITGALLIIALFILVLLILFGSSILSLWGAEFSKAYYILIILSVGQFFNIGTSVSGLLLTMCGFEKIQAKISTIFVVLNLGLNLVLITQYGVLGAAIATAVTVIGDNISKMVTAKAKLGITILPNSLGILNKS